MNRSLQAQTKNSTTPPPSFTFPQKALSKANCACGGSGCRAASCPECGSKRLSLPRQLAESEQRSPTSVAMAESQQAPSSALNDREEPPLGYNFSRVQVGAHQQQMARMTSPQGEERNSARTFSSWGETGSVNPESGAETLTSTCCPLLEGEPVSSQDKFSVIDAGARPVAGGTQAQYRFEYVGATDSTGNCACNCCAFVQFVKGFADLNGVRQSHILPGSGAAMSATTMGQDSPIVPHAGCGVATAGGGPLSDTPGMRRIRPTDNLNLHLEFDARTIDTCNSNNIVASRLFTLDITGTHPRSFSATGALG